MRDFEFRRLPRVILIIFQDGRQCQRFIFGGKQYSIPKSGHYSTFDKNWPYTPNRSFLSLLWHKIPLFVSILSNFHSFLLLFVHFKAVLLLFAIVCSLTLIFTLNFSRKTPYGPKRAFRVFYNQNSSFCFDFVTYVM